MITPSAKVIWCADLCVVITGYTPHRLQTSIWINCIFNTLALKAGLLTIVNPCFVATTSYSNNTESFFLLQWRNIHFNLRVVHLWISVSLVSVHGYLLIRFLHILLISFSYICTPHTRFHNNCPLTNLIVTVQSVALIFLIEQSSYRVQDVVWQGSGRRSASWLETATGEWSPKPANSGKICKNLRIF